MRRIVGHNRHTRRGQGERLKTRKGGIGGEKEERPGKSARRQAENPELEVSWNNQVCRTLPKRECPKIQERHQRRGRRIRLTEDVEGRDVGSNCDVSECVLVRVFST